MLFLSPVQNSQEPRRRRSCKVGKICPESDYRLFGSTWALEPGDLFPPHAVSTFPNFRSFVFFSTALQLQEATTAEEDLSFHLPTSGLLQSAILIISKFVTNTVSFLLIVILNNSGKFVKNFYILSPY